jgi:hypothetical protein
VLHCNRTAHSLKQSQPSAQVYFAHALTVSYGTFPSVLRQRPQSFQRLHPSRSIVLALRIFSSSHTCDDFTSSHLSALRIMITIRAAPITKTNMVDPFHASAHSLAALLASRRHTQPPSLHCSARAQRSKPHELHTDTLTHPTMPALPCLAPPTSTPSATQLIASA